MLNVEILINDFLQPSGTERAAVNLADSLVDQGHQVTLCSLFTGEGRPAYKVSPCVKLTHGGLDITRSVPQRLMDTVGFLNRIDDPKGKIIIGTTVAMNSALTLSRLRSRGAYIVGCEHVNYDMTGRVNRLIRRLTYPGLDRLAVLTKSESQRYRQDGIQTVVIPNSLPFWPEVPSTLENKKLLAVGRLVPEKGFQELVGLISPVLKRHPEWHLDIVGNGPLRETLEDQIAAQGLSKQIHLVPATSDIEQYYRNASIYLMSSLSEAFGMVIIEAKAYGLPVVAFDAPHGPRELVKPDDGLLVPMEQPAQFAAQVDALISDITLRRRLGQRARENVQVYLPENVGLQWKELLTEVVGERSVNGMGALERASQPLG